MRFAIMETEFNGGKDSEEMSTPQLNNWAEIQDELKTRLITNDDYSWQLPTSMEEKEEEEGEELLRYVGGVDISYSKHDGTIACGSLAVLELQTLQLVYEDSRICRLQVPYVPAFLAFREAPLLLQLLEDMKRRSNQFYPQLLMVDGNGLLHPRGFGLACHLGVMANIPAIGIGKNLHHVDGLTQSGVKNLFVAKENSCQDIIYLTGNSGFTWGVAMRSAQGSSKPIFVSIGHRVSLDTAIRIVKMTCKYRVPEPVRQADIKSREHLQKHQVGTSHNAAADG